MFSLSTLIMKLVSGAAMLSLIAAITDVMALYILPNKQTYRDIVYDDSPLLKTLGRRKKAAEKEEQKDKDKKMN